MATIENGQFQKMDKIIKFRNLVNFITYVDLEMYILRCSMYDFTDKFSGNDDNCKNEENINLQFIVAVITTNILHNGQKVTEKCQLPKKGNN